MTDCGLKQQITTQKMNNDYEKCKHVACKKRKKEKPQLIPLMDTLKSSLYCKAEMDCHGEQRD